MKDACCNTAKNDAELIEVLTAISIVSGRLARNMTILALKRQSEKGVNHHEQNDPTENLTLYNEEMEDCANGYASFILEQLEAAKETCSDPKILIEQRVDFSRWVEQGYGTADCIIIADGTLRICDYKHGLGVLVSADDNPQMKCYALGALELFDGIYDIDTVSMTIYQPRRQNISTYEISKDDVYAWADEVLKPTAELAFAGNGDFQCGEWCGFCKAKHECRARAEANLINRTL